MAFLRRHAAPSLDVVRLPWLLILFILLIPSALSAQAPTDAAAHPSARLLQPGIEQATSQATNEPIVYQFSAVEAETYLIEVDQQGLDFIVTVRTPSGELRSYDSPLKRDEREFVLLEDTAAGVYGVTIESREATRAVGRHEIRLQRIADADSRYAGALRAMTAAIAADDAGDQAAARRAVADYEAAAATWQELGRQRERAQALYATAALEYWQLYEWQRAAEHAATAAEAYRRLGEHALAANATALQADALIQHAAELEPAAAQPVMAEAQILLEAARSTHAQSGNAFDLARIENLLGVYHYYAGDWAAAKEHWTAAVPSFAAIGEWREELNVLQNLAAVYVLEGYGQQAIAAFTTILERLPVDTDPQLHSEILDNLAESHRLVGNIDEALAASAAALRVHQEIGDRIGEAYSLRGIGNAYYSAGEFELSAQYLEQALPLAREANDGQTEQGILTMLGNLAFIEKRYSDALEHHAAALGATTSPPDRAFRQVLLARDLSALGRHREAIAQARDALALAEGLSEETGAEARIELGHAHLTLGELPDAQDAYERALTVYTRLGLEAGEGAALNGLARVAQARGDLPQAVELSASSLERVEALRDRVAAPDLRAVYAAARRGYHENHVALLMALNERAGNSDGRHLRAALEASERARARMTIDLLGEATIDIRGDADPALLARRDSLFDELAAKRHQRDRLLEEGIADAANYEALAGLRNEMARLENDLNLLEAQLRRSSPQYASLTTPEILNAEQIQALLDPGTTLLQYALGEERSFVWIVTRDSIDAVALPDRSTIETSARTVFDSLRTYNPSAIARQTLDEQLEQLAQLVLEPLAGLGEAQRLLVAADGALLYVPFTLLPIESGGSIKRLVETSEVSTIPSMSVIAALRATESHSRPAQTLAVFADPVMELSDARFSARSVPLAATAEASSLETRSPVGTPLVRLPFTGRESDAIAALVPQDARLVATGFAANREAVVTAGLDQFRLVHFATHGLIDSRYPALSALALSHFDARGVPRDGLLRLHDVYNLKLNADLVVLSACETALGREVRGEGLIGFGQGFMYAGARRLIMSLWQVPDRATAELMTHFYRNLLEEDLRPAEALRRAQLAIAADRRWSDPYFWSSFILFGT